MFIAGWLVNSNPLSCVIYITKSHRSEWHFAVFILKPTKFILLTQISMFLLFKHMFMPFNKIGFLNFNKFILTTKHKRSRRSSGILKSWYIIFAMITKLANNEMIPQLNFSALLPRKHANTTSIFRIKLNIEICKNFLSIAVDRGI